MTKFKLFGIFVICSIMTYGVYHYKTSNNESERNYPRIPFISVDTVVVDTSVKDIVINEEKKSITLNLDPGIMMWYDSFHGGTIHHFNIMSKRNSSTRIRYNAEKKQLELYTDKQV